MIEESRPVKQVILMRTDLKMNAGKAAAQASHASMLFMVAAIKNQVEHAAYSGTRNLPRSPPMEMKEFFTVPEWNWLCGESDIPGWDFGGMTKIVLAVSSLDDLHAVTESARRQGITSHVVIDKTLAVPTCAAIGPSYASDLDPLTSHLRLYK